MPGTEVSSGDENIVGAVSITSGTVNVGNRRDDEYEVLCDTVGQFLRQYRTDAVGAVTITDTTLDGTTAYVTVGAVTRCVAIVSDGSGPITIDGTVTVGNQRDDEWEILCDAGAANLPFLRRYRTDSAGVVTIVNTTLDGTTAYVLVGAAVRCMAVSGTVAISNQVDDELEILCDAGAANLPFLRNYDFSGGGAPVVSNFLLDGVTPYVVIGPVARCTSVTVSNFPATQPISGSVSLLNQFDDEWAVLCDATPTTFLRRIRTDLAGAVTIANFTLAGGAFVPVGAVGQCGVIISDGSGPVTVDGTVTVGNQRDDEYEVLCDSTPTAFLRRYRTDSAGAITITNTTLDGTTAFAPVGAVGSCSDSVSNFPNDREYEILCDAGAANLPFLRRYNVSSAGVVTVTDTTLNGTTAYVLVGAAVRCTAITAAALPLPAGAATLAAQRDDEWVILCDNNGAFSRRYRTDSAGAVTSATFLLDGTTVYVPVGTVKVCGGSPNTATITFSTINLGSGAVNVGLGAEGWTAALNVATAVTPAATDFGTIGGQTVPVGYSVGIDADAGQTIANNTALTAAGVAFWTVAVRT